VKAVDTKKYAAATSLKNASEDDDCTQISDVDEKDFTDCVANEINEAAFDDNVDKSFIIQEGGTPKKVNCTDSASEVQKDVCNVHLSIPLGKIIQLTACWGDNATNVYDFFKYANANYQSHIKQQIMTTLTKQYKDIFRMVV
jgi:hypothetical protein